MGEVYRARDERLKRDVAIKVLPATVSADADRLHRFEKEARAASALNHPNIVTVYDIGQADTGSFIAMELVEGRTLRELVAEGPVPPRRLLAVASQIADGLAKAHDAGIVHRDLKPENVMLTRDGFVKILDFGLAKLTESGDSGQVTNVPTATAGTEPGVVMGTVGYMSPEQALGKPLDFRSDQFSLGAILYEMATGARAFSGPNVVDTLSAILHKEPAPIARLNAAVPVPLRWTVERCLAKDPEGRYVSTRDLARELQQIRDHSSQTEVEAPLDGGRRTIRSSWRWVAGALVAGLALGAAAAWLRLRPVEQHLQFRQITFQRGVIWGAAFAPDGHVVYAANEDGTRARFYDLAPGAALPVPLSIDADVLLSISRTGELAVLRGGRASPAGYWESGTLARVPISGGAPKDLVKDALTAAWDAGGSDLAVTRVLEGELVLEYPLGKMPSRVDVVDTQTGGAVSCASFPSSTPQARSASAASGSRGTAARSYSARLDAIQPCIW